MNLHIGFGAGPDLQYSALGFETHCCGSRRAVRRTSDGMEWISPLKAVCTLLLLLQLALGLCIGGRAQVVFKPLEPVLHSSAPEVPESPGLPNVLILGDSISFGYLQPVRQLLFERANVQHGGRNQFNSAYIAAHLDEWLSGGHWDVIHFNYGLWDMKFVDKAGADSAVEAGRQMGTVADYEKNLRAIAIRLRATGAKLIFATSTPVPPGTLSRHAGDEEAYNRAAVRVMGELGIRVNDLHAWALSHSPQMQLPANVHYTPAGYEMLAHAVAQSVCEVLPQTAPLLLPPPPPLEGVVGRKITLELEGLTLAWIAPGSFVLGSPDSKVANERPATSVTISRGFWMGQSEVTQGQWRRLMGASVFAPADGDVAVYNVSWNDAMEFCHRLTAREQARGRVPPGYEFRLSTEAEWEYACRAGSPTEVKLTDDNGWSWTNSRASGVTAAHPKAQKASNHWGLHDMLGNVWEWCFDWYGPYPGGSEIDPAGSAPGLAHVMRGGCWWDAAATCTSSVRGWAGPDDRYVSVGFRVVLGPCIQAPRLPPTTKGYNISDSVENPPL